MKRNIEIKSRIRIRLERPQKDDGPERNDCHSRDSMDELEKQGREGSKMRKKGKRKEVNVELVKIASKVQTISSDTVLDRRISQRERRRVGRASCASGLVVAARFKLDDFGKTRGRLDEDISIESTSASASSQILRPCGFPARNSVVDQEISRRPRGRGFVSR